MDSNGKVLLEGKKFELCIERLSYQVIEMYRDFDNICFIGLQPRGVLLSDRIIAHLKHWYPSEQIRYGKLDITFYRDDFRTRSKPLVANATHIDFLVEGKHVVLFDDVLYTGRSIQAALTAIQHYGRPSQVQLVTLVDRRFNRELPIQAQIVGLTVDALDESYVRVDWRENADIDRVVLFSKKD